MTEVQRTKMPEQDPKVRARNFDEVALGYTIELAQKEAAVITSYSIHYTKLYEVQALLHAGRPKGWHCVAVSQRRLAHAKRCQRSNMA